MKPEFAYLRGQFGRTCLAYIHDSFYLEISYIECEEATLHAAQFIISLAFEIHYEKSVIIPTQTCEFLGFGKIVQLCQTLSHQNKQLTIREVASFLGTLVSDFPGVQFGPLHYCRTEADKERSLKLNQGNFDAVK